MAADTTSSISNLLASEVLSGLVETILAEDGSVMAHEAILYAPNPGGSLVVRASADGLGGSAGFSSVAEGSSVGDTALSTAKADVTLVRFAKSYAFTELALAVGGDRLAQERFARDAVISYNQKLIELTAALGSGFSNAVGSTGVNMTVQNFVDAKAKLDENAAKGRYLCILHPVQFADLQNALIGSTGVIESREDAQGMLEGLNGQYKGSFLGVDIFTSKLVPTANAGADRAGCMIARGAMVWSDAPISENAQQVMNANGKLALEVERDAKAGETSYVSSTIMGVAEFQDLMGVGIVTDA